MFASLAVNVFSALKYHPDRNPGRELEFNAKFQAIQAAHEILSDPQQRLRYDTDRLRAGYGKLYGPPKANTSRKTPANPYASASTAKPQTPKPPSAGRPQSFQNGPSTGAQRYASYARAAPKQPWEKMQDEGQTRADAYRGFQEMKGNSSPGWSHFDPRTGRTAYTGTAHRPDATPNGHPTRPKSAYEYFKASPKTATNESSRTQSTRKKQGFAPRTAGGDEPMAANTSSYTSIPRRERFQASDSFQRETAPSPTEERPTPTSGYRAENTATPDFERTGSKYASTGGERTFFSSSWLHSEGVRNSPKNSRAQSRTNPPSPTPPPTARHKSASPKLRSDRGQNYDSTSSSGTEDDFVSRKPKAVPKSRLQNQKFANLRSQTGSTPTTGKPPSPSQLTSSRRLVFCCLLHDGSVQDDSVANRYHQTPPSQRRLKIFSVHSRQTRMRHSPWLCNVTLTLTSSTVEIRRLRLAKHHQMELSRVAVTMIYASRLLPMVGKSILGLGHSYPPLQRMPDLT